MSELSGRRVAVMVVASVVLTAVIPPGAAYALARWRNEQTAARAAEAGVMLSARTQDIARLAATRDVVCGSGTQPGVTDAGQDWLRQPPRLPDWFRPAWPADHWGRCYLLDVRSIADRGQGLLISAGANGRIETPLGSVAAFGDDIAVVVR